MSISLTRALQILIFLFLLFTILHLAKPFLVPLAFAGLFSMLLLPLSQTLERKMSRPVSILVCISLLLLFVAVVGFLISWQVADLASNASKIEQQVTQNIQSIRKNISEGLGISQQEQQKFVQKQQSSGSGKMTSIVTTIVSSLASILGNSVLVLVYIFLFLYFRDRIKTFILRISDRNKSGETKEVLQKSRRVAQKYLSGLAMMIVCLWILYGIGFTIVGVKNALFFAILCGLLEIVPFIGNLTGTALTAFMVMAQGGSTGMLIGVLATYAVVQTFQTYILEPLVVGSNVSINPLFTIIVIVLGEFIWGIPGMILAIPLLGIVKIICDHVPVLQPVGYLIGQDKKDEQPEWIEKIKRLLNRN